MNILQQINERMEAALAVRDIPALRAIRKELAQLEARGLQDVGEMFDSAVPADILLLVTADE